MCPDRDLLSAHADGEVPSPWRERLDEHVASCPDCAAVLAGYVDLSGALRAGAEPDEPAALARGRERLDALLEGMHATPPRTAPRPSAAREAFGRALGRSISLPLPFAAAAALLVLFLGGATAVLALRPERGNPMQAVATGGLDQRLAKPASMEELLRFLNSSDGQVQLTINLPADATFGSAGTPVIMRSAEAAPGTVLGGGSP
jgi:anti-sigma factor RsiW